MSSWTVWCIWFLAITSAVELGYKGYKYYHRVTPDPSGEVNKDKEIELETEKKISNKGI